MNETVLIVAAHPDDETIAMAGTICRHIERGDEVYVISMTNGVGSRHNSNNDEVSHRKLASSKASNILGFTWAKRFYFDDNEMDKYPLLKIVKEIEQIKNIYKPSIVYTHSCADLNIDHRVLANAVLTAFRPQPKEVCKEIRLFEVVSATDFGNPSITGSFSPNLFIDISNYWEKKCAALDAYAAELREYPHTRSMKGIKNLAQLRGSQIGVQFAEAYEIIRKIEV